MGVTQTNQARFGNFARYQEIGNKPTSKPVHPKRIPPLASGCQENAARIRFRSGSSGQKAEGTPLTESWDFGTAE
jgi:hypothetical protein